MQYLYKNHVLTINKLKEAYLHLPAYKQIFFPKQLKIELEKLLWLEERSHEPMPSAFAWSICDAFFNKTTKFQREHFACLRAFLRSELCVAYARTKAAGLLSNDRAKENFSSLITLPLPWIADSNGIDNAALMLCKGGLLSKHKPAEVNFDALVKHCLAGNHNPMKVAEALLLLDKYSDLLNPNLLNDDVIQDNRDAVAKSAKPLCTANQLRVIEQPIISAFVHSARSANFHTFFAAKESCSAKIKEEMLFNPSIAELN